MRKKTFFGLERLTEEVFKGSIADKAEMPPSPNRCAAVADAMKELTDKQRTVLGLKFGLNNQPPLLQKEIAALLGMCQSNVSYLASQAIHKICATLEITKNPSPRQREEMSGLYRQVKSYFNKLGNKELDPDNFADISRQQELERALDKLNTTESMIVELMLGVESGIQFTQSQIQKMSGLPQVKISFTAKQAFKKIIQHMEAPDSSVQMINQDTYNISPAERVIRAEDISQMKKAMDDHTNDEEKRLLTLFYAHATPLTIISASKRTPRSSDRVRMFRARSAIAKNML